MEEPVKHHEKQAIEFRREFRKTGGHIGYSICPSHRGKGYGTAMVALVLEKAKELGLWEIMITCEKSNRASAGVAMKNGGVLIPSCILNHTNKLVFLPKCFG